MREHATEISRKKNFFLTADLDDRVKIHIKESGLNLSQLIRDLLSRWVEEREKEKIDNEIIKACDFYYDMDKKMAAEWRSAEAEV